MKTLLKILLLLFVININACTILNSEKDEPDSDDGNRNTPGLPPPELQSFPRWHPSKNKILYYNHGIVKYDSTTNNHQRNPQKAGLWVMDANGENKTQLMQGHGFYADWSPKGDSIVFEHGHQIYKAPFQGDTVLPSQIIQLTSEGRNFFPSWSPNGQSIIFDSNINSESGLYFIWNINSKGSKKRRIIYAPLEGEVRSADWISNTRIVYANFLQNVKSSEISTNTINDNQRNRITYNEKTDRYPRYSSSNNKIAFESNAQVWVINADGSKAEQLTFGEAGRMPDWSPDGSRIVYIGPQLTIWMMNANGSDKEQLTFRREGSISNQQ